MKSYATISRLGVVFKRDIQKKLEAWRDLVPRRPLILKGARQVGKTYILKAFGAASFRQTIYVNFESNVKARELFTKDLSPRRIISDLSFLLDSPIDIKRDIVIFDEIQLAPKGITSLKYFCEEMPELAVVAAGSLIGLNLSEDSFPVGKVDMLTLYPLTFHEFLSATRREQLVEHLDSLNSGSQLTDTAHTVLFDLLKEYFVCGGMPAVVSTFAELRHDMYLACQRVRAQQATLIDTYINDFAKHCGKANALHIEAVYRSAPAQVTSDVKGRSPRFQIKNVVPGISQYYRLSSVFDWLRKANLIIKVPIITKAILPLKSRVKEGIFKLYLHDVGLLGSLAEIKPDSILAYDFSNFKGYFAENFVAQELLAAGATSTSIYCWKENTAELEFLLDISRYVLPIEVKSGNFRQLKSLKAFIERYNPESAYLLTGHSAGEYVLPKVKVLPMYMAASIVKHVG